MTPEYELWMNRRLTEMFQAWLEAHVLNCAYCMHGYGEPCYADIITPPLPVSIHTFLHLRSPRKRKISNAC